MSGVASNPFLRPSPNVPPHQVNPLATPKPPQKINPNLSKEVEFRGYFIYRGTPYFCIFNKKSNHGEWIRLNEKTFEEFEAHAFDQEKESVTLRFNGQNILLSLQKSKIDTMSPPSPSNIPPPLKNNFSSKIQSTPSSAPKVMPPRPTVRPKLPDWLLSARSVSRTPPEVALDSKPLISGPSFPAPPKRIQSSFSGSLPSNPQTPIDSVKPQFSRSNNSIPLSTVGINSATNVSVENDPEDVTFTSSTEAQETTDDGELENLPPPPPPPNILPPGPPPNIVPAER